MRFICNNLNRITYVNESCLRRFFEPPPAQIDFNIAAGILRLSDKYDVEYLKRRALRHFSALSPMSINKFDKFNIPGRWSKFCTFALINLARDTGSLWLLPAALYGSSNLNIETILDGISCSGSRFTLRESDKKSCLIARQNLVAVNATRIAESLCPSVKECATPLTCGAWKLHITKGLASEMQMPDPLTYHPEFCQPWLQICPACNAAKNSTYLRERQACWDNLPALFGLPSWSELIRMRKAALED